MADVDFDEFDGGYAAPVPGRVQRLVNLAGAAVSVALVVGLGVWGYKLAVRDVTGVPVVRALEGPMRIAPANPGGEIADHQGLAVNDIAAEGTAAAPADRLVLAPRPVELAAEDGAGLTGLSASVDAPLKPAPVSAPLIDPASPVALADVLVEPPAALPGEVAAEPLGDSVVADVPADDAATATQTAVELALAEALAGDGAVPLENQAEDAPLAGTIAANPAAVLTSPRPLARPRARAAAEGADAAAGAAPALPVAAAEIDAATITAGTRLIQLGAFDTADEAREEWAKLQTRFGPLMDGKSLVVQSAESGGRTFYRLRAHGFENADDARRFCSALLTENAACIPVVVR